MKIPISEIFGPTLQGEGPIIGRPSVFVRVGGCDYRCNWCDTLYAVLPSYKHEWIKHSTDEILEKVLLLTDGKPILVTLTGGNPALYNLTELLEKGRKRGLTFALETQASVAKPWFALLDYLILSPKGPSSGMQANWDTVRACLDAAGNDVSTALKIVVFDEADYQFARRAYRDFADVPCYLQLGTDPQKEHPETEEDFGAKANWLLRRVMEDSWSSAIILPQMHVLLWGKKRGV